MKLINTIEIIAFEYAINEYTFPVGTDYDTPKGWDMYRKQCLSDRGLEHILKNNNYKYAHKISMILSGNNSIK